VRPDIFEAWEGISAGGDVRHLLLGNPVISSGPFFDLFANESPGWDRFTIDAFDTPNLRDLSLESLLALEDDGLEVSERPYLVTRRWVVDRYHEWGVDHPLWQARVRGQFPLQADDALISLAWLEDAANRRPKPSTLPVIAGIDVAGPGEDETVLVIRRGGSVLALLAYAQADSRGPVLADLRPWLHEGLTTVNVDTAGSGHYFAAAIRDELPQRVTVRDVNVGESPTTDAAKERYANLKAELYWALRERFEQGDIAGLTDRTARAQLAGLRYDHDGRGRVRIESKDDARKRGVKSPDRAEAVMLAFAPDDPKAGRASLYGLRSG
jgi:phage terminase large subunit